MSVYQIAGGIFLVVFGLSEFTAIPSLSLILGASGIVAGIALLAGK